jgi:hypothetical protein
MRLNLVKPSSSDRSAVTKTAGTATRVARSVNLVAESGPTARMSSSWPRSPVNPTARPVRLTVGVAGSAVAPVVGTAQGDGGLP